jgi:16S rRNA (cytidine1402-2'-O)-methyltransferase
MTCGTLYLVPTPIGNLEDITLRALRVLKEVDFVACEDTRQTVKLMNHYGIKKSLVSFFTYNQLQRLPRILADLRAGKNVALVSDSGTPGISDPGFYLIRGAIDEHIPVVPLPGPSAVTTALVASGLPMDGFVFLGFLKRKAGKVRKELREAVVPGKTIVFYESPYRVKRTLTLCRDVFTDEAQVVLAREITKKFEEFIRGTLGTVIDAIKDRDLRGEFVILVSPVEGTIAAAGAENETQGRETDHD